MLLASPERIVLSGGVMQRARLFPMVRTKLQQMLNGYLAVPQLTAAHVESYVTPSRWGNAHGIVGTLTLAGRAFADAKADVPPAHAQMCLMMK